MGRTNLPQGGIQQGTTTLPDLTKPQEMSGAHHFCNTSLSHLDCFHRLPPFLRQHGFTGTWGCTQKQPRCVLTGTCARSLAPKIGAWAKGDTLWCHKTLYLSAYRKRTAYNNFGVPQRKRRVLLQHILFGPTRETHRYTIKLGPFLSHAKVGVPNKNNFRDLTQVNIALSTHNRGKTTYSPPLS